MTNREQWLPILRAAVWVAAILTVLGLVVLALLLVAAFFVQPY